MNKKTEYNYNLIVGIILIIIIMFILIGSILRITKYYKEKKEWDNKNFSEYINKDINDEIKMWIEINYCYYKEYKNEADKKYCEKYNISEMIK
ncbi:MAG TPA: hypothetical protein PK993_04045 [Clostridia bacterium]|nr:hypothetical protein [Clostridia bacterium]